MKAADIMYDNSTSVAQKRRKMEQLALEAPDDDEVKGYFEMLLTMENARHG